MSIKLNNCMQVLFVDSNNNNNPTLRRKMSFILIMILGIPIALVLYVFYMFFIKIYVDAARFRKMDPNLKTFISPFSGIQGVQKFNIEKFGDSHKFAKDLVREDN